jgi:ring-1,2-phenylacetyl-CoA epoxidase subunit PaaD
MGTRSALSMTSKTLTADIHRLRAAVEGVLDPELGGVTIGQLGLIREIRVTQQCVIVELSPTFLGCVAMGLITLDVESAAIKSGFERCAVLHSPRTWSTNDITTEGIASLQALGIVVVREGAGLAEAVCPFCDSVGLEQQSAAGPTRCRLIAWCRECRNVVEAMMPKTFSKPVS